MYNTKPSEEGYVSMNKSFPYSLYHKPLIITTRGCGLLCVDALGMERTTITPPVYDDVYPHHRVFSCFFDLFCCGVGELIPLAIYFNFLKRQTDCNERSYLSCHTDLLRPFLADVSHRFFGEHVPKKDMPCPVF